MSDEDEKDTRSPTLKVLDGDLPQGDDGKKWLKTFFDMEGDNFLGSGMTFHEWSRFGDVIRYHRWYGNRARDEKKRRMKYIIAMSSEHERVCAQDRFATSWSEACIEAVIEGDWNGVQSSAQGLKFEDEGADIRNIAALRFAKFVEIAMEAYETRPKVFCPVCRRPSPQEYIGAHPDGRHHCPWCQVVYDDAGKWVKKDKANLTPVQDLKSEEPQDE